MLTLEFHSHSIFSKDSLVTPLKMVQAARKKGISRLVVTDHNTIRGAIEAKRIDPELVIVGEEILTSQGEILAAFVCEEIPAKLQPQEAIRRLRDQGAFISVSHPFDERRGWKLENLLEIAPLVDAVEVFNARCFSNNYNLLAAEFARKHQMLGTIGSDAHTLRELGRAVSVLEKDFHDADTLKSALQTAGARTKLSNPLIHTTSRFAVTVKKLGWVKSP